ncbi:MAG: NYN domain-containing protein [Kiritimatiellaeota bacterium]|nr:NYN domain-containing protein [Kiritimatiellota bacterium]
MSLHPLLVEGLGDMVRRAPLEEVRGFAAETPGFSTGGFRAVNADKLRARAVQVLSRVLADAPEEDRPELIEPLKPDPLTLVDLFSEFVVMDFADELAAVMGAGPFLFACWTDDRKSVRAKAGDCLKKEEPFKPMTPGDAAGALAGAVDAGQFARFLAAINKIHSKENPPAAAPEESPKLKEDNARLREENRRLKGADDRAARQRERAEKAEAALAAALAAQRASEADARRLASECGEARAELAREARDRETRLAALHEAEMARAFEGWLDRAREVELEIQRDCGPLERAGAALKHQADSERHSGNRAALLARRDAVEAMRRRVAAALADAFRPTAALVASARELDGEAGRLDALLDVQNIPASPLENAIALHAHTADENGLYHLATLLARMGEIAALDAPALGRLRAVLARRQAFFHAAAGDPANVAAESGPAAVLRRALLCEKGVFLIVDGHNILFALQGKYATNASPVVPDREKRGRFVADVTRVALGRPTCRAWVVFDGPVRNEDSPAPNVRVVYSGGSGEHRADKVVAETARFFRRAEPGVPVIVATNDNELRGEAQKIGALPMTASELGQFL